MQTLERDLELPQAVANSRLCKQRPTTEVSMPEVRRLKSGAKKKPGWLARFLSGVELRCGYISTRRELATKMPLVSLTRNVTATPRASQNQRRREEHAST